MATDPVDQYEGQGNYPSGDFANGYGIVEVTDLTKDSVTIRVSGVEYGPIGTVMGLTFVKTTQNPSYMGPDTVGQYECAVYSDMGGAGGSFTLKNLTPSTTYYVYTQTYQAEYPDPMTQGVYAFSFTTLEAPTIHAYVKDFKAISKDAGEITVTNVDYSGDIQVAFAKTSDDTDWFILEGTTPSVGDEAVYTASGLENKVEYRVYTRVFDGAPKPADYSKPPENSNFIREVTEDGNEMTVVFEAPDDPIKGVYPIDHVGYNSVVYKYGLETESGEPSQFPNDAHPASYREVIVDTAVSVAEKASPDVPVLSHKDWYTWESNVGMPIPQDFGSSKDTIFSGLNSGTEYILTANVKIGYGDASQPYSEPIEIVYTNVYTTTFTTLSDPDVKTDNIIPTQSTVSLNISIPSLIEQDYPVSDIVLTARPKDGSKSSTINVNLTSTNNNPTVAITGLAPSTEYNLECSSTTLGLSKNIGSFTTKDQVDQSTKKMFKYWAKDGEQYDFDTPVTSDFILTGVWSSVFTVSFIDSFNEKVYDDQTVLEDGMGLVLKDAPEKEGYVWQGWYSSIDGHKWDPATDEVTQNMVLIAVYTNMEEAA